jgi:glycosyltransferase involved in cell wall biosynthesis
LFFSGYAFGFIREFFSKKVFYRKKKLIAWYNATVNAIFLLSHPKIKEIIHDKQNAKNTILLFFWGMGSCEFLPFIDTRIFRKVLVKMHRYDLFEYLYEDYIPYRKKLIQHATHILPSHLEGLQYLQKKYPGFRNKFLINRVGTKPSGKTVSPGASEKMIIYSCSTLSEVKRVNLMLAAAAKLTIPFEWYHIGDGVLKDALLAEKAALKLEGKFNFLGFVQPAVLKEFYLGKTIDLFVNTSASEGIPVSILEMLSLGVPVLATDVGSVREAVDDSVGHLLPKELTVEKLVKELELMYAKIKTEKKSYTAACISKFNEIGNSDIANNELVQILLQ